ncbi:MAG: potassium channel family protein, partial [Acidobacteriia bacterium]|nr:potassium channel family protein [Terriglobia bacterium]
GRRGRHAALLTRDAEGKRTRKLDSFVVQVWRRVLSAAAWVSPLEWIWFVFPRLRTHGWVDVWVFLNLALSLVALLVASQVGFCTLVIGLVTYGGIRVLEVVVYQANVVLFNPYRESPATANYAVRSYRRIVILALHNYVEAVVWFAAAYATYRHLFGGKADVLSTPVGALYFSMVTMTTVGYGEITPANDGARALVIAHLLVAVFMTLVILARFVGFLPVPRTMDDTERPAT